MLRDPFMTQAEIAEITRAKPVWIQTWVNSGHVSIDEPNPGRGHPRLYSELDAVKLSLMARTAVFGIGADRTKDVVDAVAATLIEGRAIDWEAHVSFGFARLWAQDRTGLRIDVAHEQPRRSPLDRIAVYGDLEDMRLSSVAEWFRGLGLGARRDGSGRIVPTERNRLAADGVHAEPFLFLPIGEIVNAVRLRVQTLREARS